MFLYDKEKLSLFKSFCALNNASYQDGGNNSQRLKLIIKYFPNFKLLKLNISDKIPHLLKKLEWTIPKLSKHSNQSRKSTVADSHICLLGKIISAEVYNI